MQLKLITGFFVCVASYVMAQNAINIPQKGLQAYWPFSGNANDVSGNSRHGKAHGSMLVKDRFGNNNFAYSFNGVDDFISTEYPGILGNHPRAVSFWATVADTLNPYAVIVWGKNDLFPYLGARFDCGFNQKRAGATVGISDAYITFETHEPVYGSTWHHYVFQYSGTYLKDVEVYQDGVMLTHEPSRWYPITKINTRRGANVTLGAIWDTLAPLPIFKGQLDDVAIYDRTLSPAEINELYLAPDPIKKLDIKRLMLWVSVIMTTILLAAFLIRFTVKKLVKRGKEKLILQNQWYEQENRIMQAQMDPHFIFNSMNTIQQFIISNDNEKAQLYLTKFSRLVRLLLESNSKDSVSLKDEKELYERYLEIESLRFNNIFDYEIVMPPHINLDTVFIPRFLVQPFIENAICHGLLPKAGYKELDILFEILPGDMMRCTIEDNGVGRKQSAEATKNNMSVKTKRLGIGFVSHRLNNMSKVDGRDYYVKITDKTDEDGKPTGTQVIIQMPIVKK